MSKLAQSLKVVRGYVLLEELENEKPSSFLIEDDKESFARGCLDLLRDRALARQLTEANYNFVRSHYGLEAMSKGLEKALAN